MFTKKQECYGCPTAIHCICKIQRYCPVHTPSRWGQMRFTCYVGMLAAVAGIT